STRGTIADPGRRSRRAGQAPARVYPARAVEGDSEGAGRGRHHAGAVRVEAAPGRGAPSGSGPARGRPRVATPDEHSVDLSRIPGLAHLSRMASRSALESEHRGPAG